ncbi:hypothetical protein ABPG75_005696 [Micractinium tetrahymenae]
MQCAAAAVRTVCRAARSSRRGSSVCPAAANRRRQGAAGSSGSGGSTDGGTGGGGGSGARSAAGSAAFTAAAAAAAAGGPLPERHLLAAKLTETAKNIEWCDPPADRPAEATREQIDALEARLGYKFKNRYLLRLALVHSSAAPTTHNAILAWLGDAALYIIIAEQVAASLGNMAIGKLSEVRKTLIGRAMCDRYARYLGLAPYLVLGKSVRLQTQLDMALPTTNMVAEMFEAVMGAIYLDGDLAAVRAIYTSHFPLPADPLTLLQPDGTGGPLPPPSSSSSSDGGPSPWSAQ